ncbi:MAG: Glu/Leu/Phe/Val dehydrogenase dimerization domain-containing protein [Solirubrobacterales bacterium]
MDSTQEMDSAQLWSCEQLVLCHDPAVGLQGVIAIDDTTLGPGLGGVRLKAYGSDAAAIVECQRLASAMTLKNALAQVPYGGAKSVITAAGEIEDREALMERFGEFVARTGGAYLPGVDMGTTTTDLATIAATGVEVSCSEQDPSPWTALGVAAAIGAAVSHVYDGAGMAGVRVLVQGAGHVGACLARELAADGAELFVADLDEARAAALCAEIGAKVVGPGDVLSTPCEVFAPCAVARVVNPETADRLACRIVAGAANDTLADRDSGSRLAARGIAYVPDFLANAGGVVQIHGLREGWDEARLQGEVAAIGERAREVLEEAEATGTTPLVAAERRAGRHLREARSAAGKGEVVL